MRRYLLLWILNLLLNEGNCQILSSYLKRGDIAPSLKQCIPVVGDFWERESRTDMFVVEFGSIYCGPCREIIPHLSELSDKYRGKVSILSIYIYENGKSPRDTISTGYVKSVSKFVEKMSTRIRYSIAVDGPGQMLAERWLIASRYGSIPVSFVVKRGVIQWLGNPVYLGEVLDQIIEDKLDGRYWDSLQSKDMNQFEETIKMAEQGNYELAISIIDEMLLRHPHSSILTMYKFNYLLYLDEKSAYTFGKKILDNCLVEDEPALYKIAYSIIENKNKLKNPDWGLVVKMTQKGLELCKDNLLRANISLVQSKAYFFSDNVDKAISILRKELDTLASDNTNQLNLPLMEQIEQQLKIYQDSKM